MSDFGDLSTREQRQVFYQSSDWRNLRNYVISIEPFCRQCKAEGYIILAEEVDHIIDIVDNPSKALDISNLQPLCRSCHSRKTMKTTQKKKKGENETIKIINKLWKK